MEGNGQMDLSGQMEGNEQMFNNEEVNQEHAKPKLEVQNNDFKRRRLNEPIFLSDMEFIFENESNDVRIPAKKSVLAASSPVFNAMFNGDLKENGDVKITDASSHAFEEFLRFFYDQHMNITLKNIGDIVYLAHKYDVTGLLLICVEFLKKNLTIDNILLGMHWAIKFHLDDLRLFCEGEIQKNIAAIYKMFDFDTTDKITLISDLEIDVDKIVPYIFAISRNIFVNQAAENEKRRKSVYRFDLKLSKESALNEVSTKESIQFSLDGYMLLTDIFCSSIYEHYGGSVYTMLITEIDPQSKSNELYREEITLNSNGTHLHISSPFTIKAYHIYEILMIRKLYSAMKNRTKRANIPYKSSKLTENINIWFPLINGEIYKRTLIDGLQFKEICEN